MTIHIVRHGKTVANEQKLYCGATDISLSENGIAELNEFRQMRIYPHMPQIFFTSGLKRTEETLDILYGTVPRAPLLNLAEFNFGCFEMKSYEMLKDNPSYQTWITDEDGSFTCPGGESRHGFNIRILEGYKQLLHHANAEALLITHGGVIATLMEYLFPNIRNFYEWQPKPGRGYTINVKDGTFHEI